MTNGMKKMAMAAFVAAAAAGVILPNMPNDTPETLRDFARMSPTEKQAFKRSEREQANIGDELLSFRGPHSKHFKGENGTVRAEIHAKAQHYFDLEDSTMKEYDFTVRDVDASVKNHPNRKGDKVVFIGNDAMNWFNGKPHDYSFTTSDSASIEYTALHDGTNITVETIPNETGVKQNYILADASAATELSWLVNTNAVMQSADANADIIYEYEGEFAFMISAPVAWDADSQNIFVNSWVDGDTLKYNVQLPENVSWPVTVDPSTFFNAVDSGSGGIYGNSLTWSTIRGSGESLTYASGANATGYAGSNKDGNAKYWIRRTYMKFTTSPIGSDAVVTAATLHIFGEGGNGQTLAANLVKGNYDWGTLNASDWTNVSTTVIADSLIVTVSSDSLVFPITDLTAINKIGSTVMVIRDTHDLYNAVPPYPAFPTNRFLNFKPSESYLEVTYSVPFGNPPTDFILHTPTTTAINASWTVNHSGSILNEIWSNAAEDLLDVMPSNQDSTYQEAELIPNTEYIRKVGADSTGASFAYSNLDSLFTLTVAPSNLALAEEDSLHVTLTFDAGANPDSTLFAAKNENWGNWYTATGDTTASESWLTRAAWLAKILLVPKDANVTITVKGKNGDGVETASISASIVTNNLKKVLIQFDNWISKTANDATYGTARGESFSANITTEAGYAVGQNYSGGIYYVYRLAGEVAVPPEPDSLITMSLKLTGSSDASTTDFNLEGRVGSWSSFDYTVYYLWDGARGTTTEHEGTNLLSAWNSSSFIVGENNIAFSSAGEDSVKAYYGQMMPISFISSRDGSATAATDSEISGFGSAALYMEYYDYDNEPSGVTITSLSATTIEVSWSDESNTETGFQVCAASDSTALGSITAANATADTLTVIPNTLYQLVVKVIGGKKDGAYSAASTARYSWAAYPVYPPVATIISSSSIMIAPDSSESGNPPDTDWAIMMISTANDTGWVDLSQNPVALNMNPLGLDDDWGWGTPSEWNVAGGGVLLTGLAKGHRYFRYAETRNHVSP